MVKVPPKGVRRLFGVGVFCVVFLSACTGDMDQFVSAQQELFQVTPVTGKTTRTITLANGNGSSVQHVFAMGFGAGANKDGHFKIEKVDVDGAAQGMKDLSVPPNSNLHLTITYEPLNLKETDASYGGWVTGNPVPPDVEKTQKPKKKEESTSTKAMKFMSGANPVPHRSYILIEYDYPTEGYLQIELVGWAVPGPNGEVESTPAGAGGGPCTAGGTTACYTGGFAIDLPGLMQGGPSDLKLTAPVAFTVEGDSVKLDMNTFPNVLLVLRGNGPGEPLEGKPISSVSIVISGAIDEVGTGTFDGRELNLTGVGFRIRVVLGELTEKDITPGLSAAVDFNVKDLVMTTLEPYDNGKITLGVDTTLSQNPSGNSVFDQFLGGQQVIVVMKGELALP